MPKERGTLVSSGHSETLSEMEERFYPADAISEWTAEVVKDLVERVGYMNKITVTIEVVDERLNIKARTRLSS